MTVSLHRDPHLGEHVLELPAFVIPRAPGRYFHEPRSAALTDRGLLVTLWCGPWRSDVREHELTDTAPSQDRCGTCMGRRTGFDRGDGLIFRPRDPWAMPARCPGGNDGSGNCLSCGRRLRYYGAFTSRECDHRPEPALLERWEPCPYHGWLNIHAFEREGFLACTAWRCPTSSEVAG